MNRPRPAFYAVPGTTIGDIVGLLHPPYTAWHLGYVMIGASLAPTVDWLRLTGTLLAFFSGTGVAAHALDELNGRPLRSTLKGRTLLLMAGIGFTAVIGLAVAGVFVVSPWIAAWTVGGVALASGYALAQRGPIHSSLGFALAWGAFPVAAAFWVQAERFDLATLFACAAAALLSLAQRSLSSRARYVRRVALDAAVEITLEEGSRPWSRGELLSTWERPLKLLSWAVLALAGALLTRHL